MWSAKSLHWPALRATISRVANVARAFLLKEYKLIKVFLFKRRNHQAIVKVAMFPTLGLQNSSEQMELFATYQSEFAFYRYVVPPMRAAPWKITVQRPLKVANFGQNLMLITSRVAGDFYHRSADLANDTVILQVRAKYHTFHWGISRTDLRVLELVKARNASQYIRHPYSKGSEHTQRVALKVNPLSSKLAR